MKSADEILENWDNGEEFNDWYAIDQYSKGTVLRLFVGDKEEAKRRAADRVTGLNLVDSDGNPVEPGWNGEENTPFFRCLLIPADEAKAYFEGIIDDTPDWITRKKAAEILGVSLGRVSQLANAGQLDTLGKLVSRADVEARKEAAPKAGRRW